MAVLSIGLNILSIGASDALSIGLYLLSIGLSDASIVANLISLLSIGPNLLSIGHLYFMKKFMNHDPLFVARLCMLLDIC